MLQKRRATPTVGLGLAAYITFVIRYVMIQILCFYHIDTKLFFPHWLCGSCHTNTDFVK